MTTYTEAPFGREWFQFPAVLPTDCPVPGCAYSANACPGHSCEWFAQTGVLVHCAGGRPATTTVDHAYIGRIPTCADCARKAEGR